MGLWKKKEVQRMKIISGGQTGVDKIGLIVAKSLGLETSGTAPKGWRTEDGPDLTLRDVYGLVEHESKAYPPRTLKNIKDSDCTWVFGKIETGTKLTIDLCKQEKKPYLENPTLTEMLLMRKTIKPKVINIAGNRGSKLTTLESVSISSLLKSALSISINEEKQELF